MHGRCETCRHWDRRPSKFDRFVGYCLLAEANDDQNPVHSQTMALAYGTANDYGDAPADLVTTPDFGCVQWETKIE